MNLKAKEGGENITKPSILTELFSTFREPYDIAYSLLARAIQLYNMGLWDEGFFNAVQSIEVALLIQLAQNTIKPPPKNAYTLGTLLNVQINGETYFKTLLGDLYDKCVLVKDRRNSYVHPVGPISLLTSLGNVGDIFKAKFPDKYSRLCNDAKARGSAFLTQHKKDLDLYHKFLKRLEAIPDVTWAINTKTKDALLEDILQRMPCSINEIDNLTLLSSKYIRRRAYDTIKIVMRVLAKLDVVLLDTKLPQYYQVTKRPHTALKLKKDETLE